MAVHEAAQIRDGQVGRNFRENNARGYEARQRVCRIVPTLFHEDADARGNTIGGQSGHPALAQASSYLRCAESNMALLCGSGFMAKAIRRASISAHNITTLSDVGTTSLGRALLGK